VLSFLRFATRLAIYIVNQEKLIGENKMERNEVHKIVDGELDYQDVKWVDRNVENGVPDEDKPVSEWVNYMEYHLSKAKAAVYHLNKDAALEEIRKVTALGTRTMMVHGCPERKLKSNDSKSCSCDNCDCKK
jgi:hypothetical protein